MPYALVATGGELLAGMADGRIVRSDDDGDTWEAAPVRLESVRAMAAGG